MTGRTRHHERGSALLAATIMVVTVVTMSAIMLSLSVRYRAATSNAHDLHRALDAARSGISIAYAELIQGADAGADGVGNSDGVLSGAAFSARIDPAFGGDGEYTIVSTGEYGGESRSVSITVSVGSAAGLEYGFFGARSVAASGNSQIDSYNSALGTYASQAVNVNPVTLHSYANADGNVASNGDIRLSQQAAVYGNATPGPSGSVTTIGHAYVSGSTSSATETRTPAATAYQPPNVPSAPLILGRDEVVTLTSGTYRFSMIDLGSNGEIRVDGDVTIFVDGILKTKGQSQILMSSASDLEVQCNGIVDIKGRGIVNNTFDPANLKVEGHSAQPVTFGGSADFYGVIYAPLADVLGAGSAHYFGAMIGDSFTLSGNMKLHYDEALSGSSSDSSEETSIIVWRER